MDLLIHKVEYNEDWSVLLVHLSKRAVIRQKDEITDYIIEIAQLNPRLFITNVIKYIHLPKYNFRTEYQGLYIMVTDEDISEDAAVDLMYKHLLGEI